MPDIIIKDEQGNDVVYSNVNTVRFRDNNNGIASYRYNSGEVTPTDYDYTVIFAENDGTVIKTYYVDAGDSVVAPTPATIEGWTFNCWRYNGDLTNVDQNIIALPYYTKTGVPLTSDYIGFYNYTGSLTIRFYFTSAGTISINWGDGNVSTLKRTSVGNTSTSHTYAEQYLNTYIEITVSGSTSGVKWEFFGAASGSAISIEDGVQFIQVHSGCTDIYQYAFRGCNDLRLLSIPDGITTISSYSFQYCSLKTLSFPESVHYLGDYSIYSSTISFLVASGLLSIGVSAMRSARIVEFVIPRTVSEIKSNAFTDCRTLKKISVYANISSFGTYTAQFSNCTRLEEALIQNITDLPKSLFDGCINLCNVELNSSITSFGDSAFYNCAVSIEEIPSTVISIGSTAFNFPSYCAYLNPPAITGLNVYPTTPPTLGTAAFKSNAVSKYRPIHVPAASLNLYKAATNWASYANFMIGDL